MIITIYLLFQFFHQLQNQSDDDFIDTDNFKLNLFETDTMNKSIYEGLNGVERNYVAFPGLKSHD